MKCAIGLWIGLWVSLAAHAEAPMRQSVTDARPLMVAALQNGEAHGVLAGELADAISQRFASTSPIYIDVTSVRRYQQAGCRRLQVLYWQDDVLLPGATVPRQQSISFGINYCLDGLPPKSLR